jgi:NADPH2:quinone reductase
MRAVLCKEFGPPESLVMEEVPEPTAGPGQVLVDVHACGVNYPDFLVIQNQYQFKPPLPFSPGGEISGTIAAVGEGVTNHSVGDRVFGSTGWGGMAEKVVMPAGGAWPVPDGMDLDAAAGVLFTYGTSYYALKDRGSLKAGETLLVLGAAGGVGLAAVELGRAMGARVIAAASTDDKLALCKERGADELINYSTEDLKARLKEITAGHGCDVVYDPVGGEYAEPAVRSMAWDGRFLVIGFTAGIPRIPLNLALLKSCQIVGVFWGAFVGREPERNRTYMGELMQMWKDGEIAPHISAKYPLAEAGKAIAELGERRAKGKVLVTTGTGS